MSTHYQAVDALLGDTLGKLDTGSSHVMEEFGDSDKSSILHFSLEGNCCGCLDLVLLFFLCGLHVPCLAVTCILGFRFKDLLPPTS